MHFVVVHSSVIDKINMAFLYGLYPTTLLQGWTKQICSSVAWFVNALSPFTLDARENPPKTALIGGIFKRKCIEAINITSLQPKTTIKKAYKGGRIVGDSVVFFVSL